MTEDQILALYVDKTKLHKLGGTPVSGTPDELAQKGLGRRAGESYYSRVMREKAEQKSQESRRHKRLERAASLQRAIDYKRTTGQP